LTQDSRAVRAGDAFVALQGARTHGIAFASQVMDRGAAAILAEAGTGNREQGASSPAQIAGPRSVPAVWIENLRAHLGEIAARFFDRPSEALAVIGVTGTNGKTSTVQLLTQAFTYLGHRAATIGTLGAGLYGGVLSSERTTPDVISVHALLAQFREQGATHVSMEVSSHALDQGRVDAVNFDVAVFTNLTRDHLDYHGTMAAYAAAKAKLFVWPTLRAAVINVDDAFGRQLATRLPAHVQKLRYAIESAAAEIRAREVQTHADGIDFILHTPRGKGVVHSGLLGTFNVSNLLAVAGVLSALEVPFDSIRDALETLQPVAGRMNRLGGGVCPLVVVDYSHTPDALQQALTTLRAHCEGKLICVFGAGGERDKGKRPQMGAIAEKHADLAIVTDDNPRGEDGDAIVAQILAGFAQPRCAVVQRDRARAIELALSEAKAGDVVLIAGKGHEAYQEIGGVKKPFDDLAVARKLMARVHAC
ncbi:MAG: UDP-N-acetylmuramoyl-L-alanyl-D-glutamate--2,6-diaminopimelate ligase, partial [Rhodanobacteraceae bacterium]